MHPWHQDGQRERSIFNTAVFEQGSGHPDLFPGLAWSGLVLRLVPMAKAVLVVLYIRQELRGIQMDLTFPFYWCQNPHRIPLQGCLARGGSGGTIPKHPVISSFSSSLILCVLSLLHQAVNHPIIPQRGEGWPGQHPPPSRAVFEMVKKCMNLFCIQWVYGSSHLPGMRKPGGPPRSLGRGQRTFYHRSWSLEGGVSELVGLVAGGAQPPVAYQPLPAAAQGGLKTFRKRARYFQEPGKRVPGSEPS